MEQFNDARMAYRIIVLLITARPGLERKGRSGMSAFNRPLEPGPISALKDEDIDFNEIPELDETF